jgi:hypothetical protein
MNETWGGIPAWRIARLRLALGEAELRGSDPDDTGEDLRHRALRRRFARGRRVRDAIARNFGIFRALGRRSAYRSPGDRRWIAEFLLHYVAYGRLSDRQAEVLRHIAKRLNVPPPLKDGFIDPTAVRPPPPPRRRRIAPARLAARIGAFETVLKTGEVVTVLELVEGTLQSRGERRTRAKSLLRDAALDALDALDGGKEEDEEDQEDDGET